MKKKLFLLSLLTIFSTISLAGCSFFDGIVDGGGNQNNTPSDNDKDNQLDVYHTKPHHLKLDNRVTYYQLDDNFVIPYVYLVDVNDGERYATKNITVSDKPAASRDYSKEVDVDMTTEGKKEVTVTYYCYYENGSDSSLTKMRLSTSYEITITKRRDAHYDPVEDKLIKTLQITEVPTSFIEGGEFIKPKIWAVKFDDTKQDITAQCTFSNYDLSKYGYQNVKVTYNDHTLEYEIVVHNLNEESLYPFTSPGGQFRLNMQNRLFVVGEKARTCVIKYNDDGTMTNYGYGYGHYIGDLTYRVDDESIAEIDNNTGFITSKKAGSTYIYFTFSTITLRIKVVVEEKVLMSIEVNEYRVNYYSGNVFAFAGQVVVTYQNGYSEVVDPEVNGDAVNMSVPGQYNVTISYSINGKTLSTTVPVNVLNSSGYVVSKTAMNYSIYDYERNTIAPAMPLSGTIKSLVVPVKFVKDPDDNLSKCSDDYISNYENVREDLRKCFFGTNEDVGWRSVKTYYEEESFNKVEITGKVTEIYGDDADEPKLYLTDYYDDFNMLALKNGIVDWYFAKHTEENIKDYDANGDGYIDGLNLVYLAPNAVTSGITRDVASNLWAMVKTQNDKAPNIESPVACKYFWVSYDFMYPTHEIALERTEKSDFSDPARTSSNKNPMNIKLEPRTFIHETGHMLGIDDYYSYTDNSIYFAGDINMQTLNLMGHDPYSVILYNWAKPYIPETSTRITIGDFQTTHDVILLTPEWNNLDSPFDEYFLIDLFVPTSGLNAFDAERYQSNESHNTVGVRIWHIDARLATGLSHYEDFTFDPTASNVRKICDNSFGRYSPADLEKYDQFMELQLVRNDKTYDYRTSNKVEKEHYFQKGDTFDMASFSTQFVNGNKMDNGKTLGWSITIEGIYYSEGKYTADILATKQ